MNDKHSPAKPAAANPCPTLCSARGIPHDIPTPLSSEGAEKNKSYDTNRTLFLRTHIPKTILERSIPQKILAEMMLVYEDKMPGPIALSSMP